LIRKTKCNGKYNIGMLMDEIKSVTLQRVSTIKLSIGNHQVASKTVAVLGASQNVTFSTETL